MGDLPADAGAGVAVDPIAELITTWNELNGGGGGGSGSGSRSGSGVEELGEEPSPLEFMRYVARNAPFVVRRGAAHWPATRKWNAAYLRQALGRQDVNVAVTPFGNADAPTLADDGELVFAKPHEEDQPFEDFLEFLRRQELDPTFREREREGEGEEEVRYAQTQNDNLRHEYASLFSEVERSIAFARIALDKEPDAINMWIGNSHSITAMHKDNYENIYVQVAGQKHFILLPSLCQPCVNEQDLVPATYVRDASGELKLQRDGVEEKGENDEEDGDDSGIDKVPFAIWDPELPGHRSTPYSHLARPMEVTLDPGDMLYLPAMWYHKVSQSCFEDGICVAVNYWYDMEFSGPLYPLSSFVRNIYHQKPK